jgi:hypothetical protein
MWLSYDIIVIDNITNYKPAQAYSALEPGGEHITGLEHGCDNITKINLENTYIY